MYPTFLILFHCYNFSLQHKFIWTSANWQTPYCPWNGENGQNLLRPGVLAESPGVPTTRRILFWLSFGLLYYLVRHARISVSGSAYVYFQPVIKLHRPLPHDPCHLWYTLVNGNYACLDSAYNNHTKQIPFSSRYLDLDNCFYLTLVFGLFLRLNCFLNWYQSNHFIYHFHNCLALFLWCWLALFPCLGMSSPTCPSLYGLVLVLSHPLSLVLCWYLLCL